MSTMTTGIMVVGATAAISAAGFLLVSRFIPDRWLVADSDAASALYATIGMVYAILIAIAAIAVWEPRAEVGSGAGQEASSLVEAHWAANGLPAADRDEVQRLIVDYLDHAAGPEWLSLSGRHEGTAEAEELFSTLRRRVDSAEPTTDRESTAQQAVVAQVSAAAVARRSRVAAAAEGMPGLLWPVLLVGGLISVVFLYLFGLARTFPNGLMMAVVGGMIALMIFVLYQMEFPYSRAFAIDPESLTEAAAQLRGEAR